MSAPQTWRDLLGTWIKDAREREHIAEALGVNPLTLTRWVRQESKPRLGTVRKLLTVVPEEQRVLLLTLLEEEFKDLFSEASEENTFSMSIPLEFYRLVMHTKAYMPESLLFSSLSDLILQQALKQLDPDRLGMVIIVIRCMPPSSGHTIRSLYETMGRGTPPWESQWAHRTLLLGSESLAGQAVAECRPRVNQRLSERQGLSPGYQSKWEESAVAAPIVHAGRIAGSLLVSSTQPDYFSPGRCGLIEDYAELIALAFAPEDFYMPERINLGMIPPETVQDPYLSGFRQRVVQTMLQAASKGNPISLVQAEQEVWQQIEMELLQLTHRSPGKE